MAAPQDQPRFDVARTLEETLLGVILLFWRVLRSAWGFLFEPRLFDATCRESSASQGARGMFPYARPLTYLTIAFASALATLYVFSRFVKVIEELEPFKEWLGEAFGTLDAFQALAVAFPVVAVVALYAALSTLLSRLLGCPGHFPTQLSIACYFWGTVFLALPVILLVQSILEGPNSGLFDVLWVLYGLLFLALVGRLAYRYVGMLEGLVTHGWLRATAVAVLAALAFGALSVTVIRLGSAAGAG